MPDNSPSSQLLSALQGSTTLSPTGSAPTPSISSVTPLGAILSDWNKPQTLQLPGGTNVPQLNQAYQSNQGALSQQQALLQALQGQGGVNNQSQVYNQLQGVASGKGPNPAAAMLNNATGQNVANQAALMAGQRGASSNVGLMARQIAQQGAATQQQAVGQGAALQAQQSLNAMGMAGNVAGNQVANQAAATGAATTAQQQEQQILQQALAAQNNQAVNMQSNLNNANAGLISNQANNSTAMIGGALQGIGTAAAMMAAPGGEVPDPPEDEPAEHTASNPAETAVLASPEGRAATNSSVQFRSPTSIELTGPDGKMMDLDPRLAPQTAAAIPMTAGPEPLTYQQAPPPLMPPPTGTPTTAPMAQAGPKSTVGQILNGAFSTASASMMRRSPALADASAAVKKAAGKVGKTGGAKSDSTQTATDDSALPEVDQSQTLLRALGGTTDTGSKLKRGGKVPGTPKVAGAVNSYANDTVKARLSPGEIVLPRSVTKSSDPVGESAKFVAALMAKKGKR